MFQDFVKFVHVNITTGLITSSRPFNIAFGNMNHTPFDETSFGIYM